MASTDAATQTPAAPQPWHLRLLWSPLALLGMLFGALVSAVVIEWIGMAAGFWDEPGAQHARQTLVQDITYLNADFTRSVLGVSPVELAAHAAQSVSQSVADTVERLQLEQVYQQLKTDGAGFFSKIVKWPLRQQQASTASLSTQFPLNTDLALTTFFTYLDAGLYSVQTVVVRVVVALLTLPAYLLIGFACLLDGVVARDLRKFTAANESAFAYHRYRPWAKRFFVAGWYLYIAWPGSIHPNVVFVPSALLCGLAIFNTGKWFKKFF